MADYPSFPEEQIQEAINAAQQHYADEKLLLAGVTADDGHMLALASCITVTIENGKVCLTLPLGIGKICIPIPISYDGKVAQACLSICTTWKIPTGVKVTISVGGIIIVSKSFGKC